jgi:hypothetical protein
MLIRIFSPTECGLIRDADLKKCGLNRMTTVLSTGGDALGSCRRITHPGRKSNSSISPSCNDKNVVKSTNYIIYRAFS